MGCLRCRFMPRRRHRLQQKSRAWLPRETACEQAARQERHRPTMARSPPLAGICFRSARRLLGGDPEWSWSRQPIRTIKSAVGAPHLTHAGRSLSSRRRHPIRSRVCGGSDPCRALAEFERGWMVISTAGPPASGREGCRRWVWTKPRDREIRSRRSERVVAGASRRMLESCSVVVGQGVG